MSKIMRLCTQFGLHQRKFVLSVRGVVFRVMKGSLLAAHEKVFSFLFLFQVWFSFAIRKILPFGYTHR